MHKRQHLFIRFLKLTLPKITRLYLFAFVMTVLVDMFGCSAYYQLAKESTNIHLPVLSYIIQSRTLETGIYVVDISDASIMEFGYIGVYVSYVNAIDYYAYKLETATWDRTSPWSNCNKALDRPPFILQRNNNEN